MRTILIVDNDDTTADIARQQLEGEDCRIVNTENALDAIRRMTETAFDMLITNYNRYDVPNAIDLAKVAIRLNIPRIIIHTDAPEMVKLPEDLKGRVEIVPRTFASVRDAILELLEKKE